MRVLLIEDDMCYASKLSKTLIGNQIMCDVCYYGREGLELINGSNYDTILIDINLPDINGNDLVKKIRMSNKKNIPIIVSSALSETSTKVELFSSGADDYLIKPYMIDELIMRIYNVFRRSKGYVTNNIFVPPGLVLDTKAKLITINDKTLNLTATEFALFEYMIINKDNVLRKEQIIAHLYCSIFDGRIPTRKIVDVLVCKIRRKIKEITENEYLHTKWGLGYVVTSQQQENFNNDNYQDNNCLKTVVME